MKTEDFERLKAVCEKEGFVVDCKYPDSGLVFVKKKDPLEGVEFAECINHLVYKIGKVYRTDSEIKSFISIFKNQALECFKPSTEQAYIEQLKKEAFERFGEIKEGQKFKDWDGTVFEIDDTGFLYSKRNDQLRFGGWIIYQQGKWAERVKERVEVRLTGYPTWTPNDAFGYNFCFHFKVKNGGENLETHKAGQFLASQLEKYLNNEIE